MLKKIAFISSVLFALASPALACPHSSHHAHPFVSGIPVEHNRIPEPQPRPHEDLRDLGEFHGNGDHEGRSHEEQGHESHDGDHHDGDHQDHHDGDEHFHGDHGDNE